jgi:hypothetical protein
MKINTLVWYKSVSRHFSLITEVSLWSPLNLALLSLNINLAKIYRLIPSDAHGDQLPPCASMEFKIMPFYGTIEPSMTRHVERQSAWTAGAPGGVSYSPNDAWNYIEPAVAAVVPVLPPLLEKFDIFVRLAGVFAEVMVSFFAHRNILTLAFLGPSIHQDGVHGTHCSISGKWYSHIL